MTSPKWLEEKQELGCPLEPGYVSQMEKDYYNMGFNACADILLPEMQLLVDALETFKRESEVRAAGWEYSLDEALARWKERFPDEKDSLHDS